jgi:hypothetical protein
VQRGGDALRDRRGKPALVGLWRDREVHVDEVRLA